MNERTLILDESLETHPIKNTKLPPSGIDFEGNKLVSHDNLGAIGHRNYLGYLETCYADHYSPVVTPDILWYGLLCEIASMVKETPEQYRKFFTTSSDKIEITVFSPSLIKLPLESVIAHAKKLVPTNIDLYLPVFTTSTEYSTEAFCAAFADAVSPYYNYSMMLCGFPSIVIGGTDADWKFLADSWRALVKTTLFGKNTEFPTAVQEILDACVVELNNTAHWKKMFRIENCGSGHQRQVKGWITKLQRKLPRIAYSENFTSQVSKVAYKQLDTGINYVAYYGLLSSEMDGTILRPQFGSVITEVVPKTEKPKPTDIDGVKTFKLYSNPITVKPRKLKGKWTVETESLVYAPHTPILRKPKS